MKTHFFIIVVLLATMLSLTCTTHDTVNLKLTIVPEPETQAVTAAKMNAAAGIICSRLNNSFGIPRGKIEYGVTGNQISLYISEIEDNTVASIKEVISENISLEFWETYENPEIIGSLVKANDLLRNSKGSAVDSLHDEFNVLNPLLGILRPRTTVNGEPLSSSMIGLAGKKDTGTVNDYLKLPEIKALFPPEIKFMWSLHPHRYDPSKNSFELHAIRVTSPDGRAPLGGSAIMDAKTVEGRNKSETKILLTMNAEGATKWAAITRANIGRCIAVVLNGYVSSYPMVQGEIKGVNTEISGDFTAEEAGKLAGILKSGQLPFNLRIINEQMEESVKK